MEDLSLKLAEMVEKLSLNYPWVTIIFVVLGCLVMIVSAVVAFTPSKKDDEFLLKVEENSFGKFILDFLKRFSLFHNKK